MHTVFLDVITNQLTIRPPSLTTQAWAQNCNKLLSKVLPPELWHLQSSVNKCYMYFCLKKKALSSAQLYCFTFTDSFLLKYLLNRNDILAKLLLYSQHIHT